jgi:hypothetical protein
MGQSKWLIATKKEKEKERQLELWDAPCNYWVDLKISRYHNALVFHCLEVYELCVVLIHFYGSQEREKSTNLNHTKRAQCTLRGNMPVRCLEMQRWGLHRSSQGSPRHNKFFHLSLMTRGCTCQVSLQALGTKTCVQNINFKANVFSYLICLCLNYVSLPWPCWMLHRLIIDKLLIKSFYPLRLPGGFLGLSLNPWL